jgi:hypothetical protein
VIKGQKNIFYDFLFSRPLFKKHGLGRDQRSEKHLIPSGLKTKKNIFHDFLLSRPLSKKHGPGQDQKQEKHCLSGVQGSKKTLFIAGFKNFKKIIFFLNPYQKTWCASVQRLTVKIDQRF